MSASATIAGQPFGVVGVMALDRDGDLLRHVPAPGENAADQGVVDAELVAFFADPLFGSAGDRVEVGTLARDAGCMITSRPTSWSRAATASSSRSAQPTARPTWSAACWVARAWTRNRSGRSSRLPFCSKKSKTLAVPAIARTPEGLRMSTASGMLAAPPGGLPPRLAARSTAIVEGDVGLDRFDHLADPGGLGGRRLHHPGLGLDQDRKALNRLECGGEARARRGLLGAFAAHGRRA